VERSRWLGDHLSKALAMHQADDVWAGVARHLHPDAAGRRAERPKTGSWPCPSQPHRSPHPHGGRTHAAARHPETSIPGQRTSARRNAGNPHRGNPG
ncbi:hypothetical protein, partial [Actinacidiphila oryziradicis]|uniref:hypothetical protein n=1 Tax=Actinacidiphila oryziradicis TaxID=2571141 RepID=UPI0023F0B0EA